MSELEWVSRLAVEGAWMWWTLCAAHMAVLVLRDIDNNAGVSVPRAWVASPPHREGQ